jgi:hypothetical protein
VVDAEKFLKLLAKKLADNDWGDIEPHWFDPLSADPDGDEEEQWAASLQKTITEALEELDNG